MESYFENGMDDNKVNFLHYLEFYESIYDLDKEDQPAEEIIQNPALCDEWIRIYTARQKQKMKEAYSSKGSGGRSEKTVIRNLD